MFFKLAIFFVAWSAYADSDASLTIRFAGNSSHFKVGQVIPVELTFRASTPRKYSYNNASYDRSGRLGIEQFDVNPQGRDPLYDYFHRQFAYIGGGLSSTDYLDKPRVLQRSLNEWVAIDKPGHYTLRVTSGRVGLASGEKQPNHLASNVLSFDVVEADAAWQKQTLSHAIAVLNDPSASATEKTGAEEALRYLDAPESVRELVRRLTKPDSGGTWNFAAGLLGAKDQQLVRKELEARFDAPDAALTDEYLFLLGDLRFAAMHRPLPPYPERDEASQKKWREIQEKRMADLNDSIDALYQGAVDALGGKQLTAKVSTIAAILSRPNGPHREITVPAEEIAAAFPLMNERQQETLLMFTSRLESPFMVASLQAILAKPKLTNPSLRLSALQLLQRIAPAAARKEILQEISAPHLDSFSNGVALANALSSLPDETLPQLTDLLVDRLKNNDSPTRDFDAQIIGRYATPAMLEKVREIYNRSQWDCAGADGLIRYFLRWDTNYGMQAFQNHGSSCTGQSLREIARLKRGPDVERSFMKHLDDKDLWHARDAAEVLSQLGDSEAKEAMLARLRAFHQTWQPRAAEFRQTMLAPRDVNDAMSFQYGLLQALTTAKGWALTEQEKAELEALTVRAEP